MFNTDRPRNLHLLPSFPSVALEADGVHLTPFSGLEYVVHLVDYSSHIVDNLKKPQNVVSVLHSESIRCLEDRVHVLEQDHRRLNDSVEAKAAINAEAWDYDQNSR